MRGEQCFYSWRLLCCGDVFISSCTLKSCVCGGEGGGVSETFTKGALGIKQ